MARHNDLRALARMPAREARNRPQRRTVQVIEMGMRNQHRIDRRQIAQPQPRPAQSLQNENPAREVGVDKNVLAANLEEETGMSDESNAELFARGQDRLTRLPGARRQRRAAHQRAELPGLTSKCGSNHVQLIRRESGYRRCWIGWVFASFEIVIPSEVEGSEVQLRRKDPASATNRRSFDCVRRLRLLTPLRMTIHEKGCASPRTSRA